MAEADLTHHGGRLAVSDGERDPAQADNWGPLANPRVHYEMWASRYLEHLAAGDDGAAFLLLHRLRHETPGADPWRLLELTVRAALAADQEGGTDGD